jgi:hypothetical protein
MAGSGGSNTRFVTFSEVILGPGWSSLNPDYEGFVTYHHPEDQDYPSSVTITRSDGKVLSFEVLLDFKVQIRENVIRFYGGPTEPAGQPFE